MNEPLIFDAICAEPLINVLLSSDSAVLILLARLELTVVNEPLIPAAVKDEPPPTALPFTNNEPVMSIEPVN